LPHILCSYRELLFLLLLFRPAAPLPLPYVRWHAIHSQLAQIELVSGAAPGTSHHITCSMWLSASVGGDMDAVIGDC